MKIAEIGAGNGRFAVKVAKRVGDSGCVYANDIDMRAILFMKNRIRKEGIKNMAVKKGCVVDPKLPDDYFDKIYVINSYSHFNDPVLLLSNVRRSLKRNGELIIIEYSPDKMKGGFGHTTSKTKIVSDAEKAGYYLVSMKDFLQFDNIYIFKVKSTIKL
ncbi:MAG: class I SAM-dependent methyltransferase [Bacteroidales bacterium]|nr:MAG: class I SAM-dependent methyltransferase [Bacteroidales bacterium]